MARHLSLPDRIGERRPQLDRLISDFGSFVDAFDKSRQYSGPGVYFHVKTIAARRSHASAIDALADDQFFDTRPAST